MVCIATGEDIDMEIHSGIHGNRAQEFFDELKRKRRPDRGHIGGGVVSQKWPPAQIHDRANERLVHRHIEKSVAADPGLVAKGFGDRLPKQNAGVLDRVVIINLDVALRRQLEIEQTMLGEESEHVVEERNPCGDFGNSRSVEIPGETDFGFGSFAFECGRARHGRDLSRGASD